MKLHSKRWIAEEINESSFSKEFLKLNFWFPSFNILINTRKAITYSINNFILVITKIHFQIIKKLHYYQKASCVKTFKRRFFYFLCCIFSKYGFYNCDFQITLLSEIVPTVLVIAIKNHYWLWTTISQWKKEIGHFKKYSWKAYEIPRLVMLKKYFLTFCK